MSKSLIGKVALVTGATRGIGKGISLQLAQNGAKVYITGRTMKSKDNLPGSLLSTVEEIEKRGGVAIPCQIDHEKPEQVKELFDRINKDENGKLDLLVNNAYKGVQTIFNGMRKKFYESEIKQWDDINNVGLRNHYICTTYASRIMVKNKNGLIVNITSPGGQIYLFNVAYGIGKAALDRMAVDCGIELKSQNVTCLSLCLGAVKTEQLTDPTVRDKQNKTYQKMFDEGETVEFSGKLISHMLTNPKIASYTARVVSGADYGLKYHINDIDDRVILSARRLNEMAPYILPKSLRNISANLPNYIKVPNFLLTIGNSRYIKS